MAFSATKISENIVGNKKEQVWRLNFASVTSGTFKTGLSQIEFVVFNNETTEAQGLFKKNTSTGSDSVPGSVYGSGVTSSDVGDILVKGY